MALTRVTTSPESRSTRLVTFSSTIPGSQPSAVRYKNWKFYYTMVPDTAHGSCSGRQHLPLDPDSRTSCAIPSKSPSAGQSTRRALGYGGALAAPGTAYLYDWNILPIGQLLWLKELMSYVTVPADAGSGELQPGSGAGSGCGRMPPAERLDERHPRIDNDAGGSQKSRPLRVSK